MNNVKSVNLLPVFHVCNAIILLCITAYAIATWGDLPEKVAVHFGFSGVPNRWADRGVEVILIYSMPWIITILLYAITFLLIPWLVKNRPGEVNIPEKEKLLLLPVEQQIPVWRCINEFMVAICLMVNVICCYMIYGTILVATGKSDKLNSALLFPYLVLLAAAIIFYTIRVIRITQRVTSQ